MSHEFESGFFGGRQPAWHGLGTVIDDDVVTAADALALAGLDWRVTLEPVYQHVDGLGFAEIEGKAAVTRSTDAKVLGVVGRQYTPVQNADAFAFVDNLVDDGAAKFHTAGALYGGQKVWMLAKLPDDVLIGGMESERVNAYMLLANTHDGSGSLTVCMTPVRVVCANTLNAALGGAKRCFKARHTSSIDGRVAEARRALDLSFRFVERFVATGEAMLARKLDPSEFARFLHTLVPYDLGADLTTDRKARNAAERQAAIRAIYETGADLDNVRGTAWAAYNAVAEWADWHQPTRSTVTASADENRWARIVRDTGIKDRAVELLTV